MNTPVAFLIFNRPDTAAQVFEAIRQARPSKLLVVVDLPVHPMEFPLKNPPFVIRDTIADRITHRVMYDPTFLKKVRIKLGIALGTTGI